jgi:hypothetical protein
MVAMILLALVSAATNRAGGDARVSTPQSHDVIAGIEPGRSTFADLRQAHGGLAPVLSGDAGSAALRVCYTLADGSVLLFGSNSLYLQTNRITDVQYAVSIRELDGMHPECSKSENVSLPVSVRGVLLHSKTSRAAAAMNRLGRVHRSGRTMEASRDRRLGPLRLESIYLKARSSAGKIVWISYEWTVTAD